MTSTCIGLRLQGVLGRSLMFLAFPLRFDRDGVKELGVNMEV